MAATTGPPDHLWLPQLVPLVWEGGSGLGGEARENLISAYTTCTARDGPFLAADHQWHDSIF